MVPSRLCCGPATDCGPVTSGDGGGSDFFKLMAFIPVHGDELVDLMGYGFVVGHCLTVVASGRHNIREHKSVSQSFIKLLNNGHVCCPISDVSTHDYSKIN